MFQTYGEKDPDNPTQIKVDPQSEGFPKFMEELGELMAQEIEIVYEVVTLPDTLEVEPTVLMALDKFVKI